jgi:glycerol-3-phosphate acyltransferase PlsY
LTTALACGLAYLLGGVPFSLLLVRALTGRDLRTIGSGNVGATNAARAFSGPMRAVVFVTIYVLDFTKGFVPASCFPGWFGAGWLATAAPVVYGACAVLGHVLTPFLRFKGGKGVATTCGVVAALDWVALLAALLAFLAVWLPTKRVFLGSLALGIALPVVVVAEAPGTAFTARLPVTIFCTAIAVLLFWTHRTNIKKALAQRAGAAA